MQKHSVRETVWADKHWDGTGEEAPAVSGEGAGVEESSSRISALLHAGTEVKSKPVPQQLVGNSAGLRHTEAPPCKVSGRCLMRQMTV